MSFGVPRFLVVLLVVTLGSYAALEWSTSVAQAQSPQPASSASPASLSPERQLAMDNAARNYERYCSLCHGDDREGYKNDSAPSLRSASLYGGTPMPVIMAAAYGRPGTPMGPYLDEMGGPMTMGEIRDLVGWLMIEANMRLAPYRPEELAPASGNPDLGRRIYADNCATCHGSTGEGGSGEVRGPALGNTGMLAVTPDSFLRRAILEGREGTPMQAWREKLTAHEIDSVVVFLRTRTNGWQADRTVLRSPPTPEHYVLNPSGEDPSFSLKDGRYVMADDLHRALLDKRKMVLLDTRVPYFWAMANIPGSIPIPYYTDFDSVVANLPTDGTWIVAYCECPRAAADQTVTQLRERGFAHTAVLWEGYGGWAAKGFPIEASKVALSSGSEYPPQASNDGRQAKSDRLERR